MLVNILTKTVRDRWRGITITFVCMAGMLLFAMSMYQNFDVTIYQEMPDIMKAIMGIPPAADAAVLAISVYLTGVGAWVLCGLVIAQGSASIASEESDGTIGILLANPKSRTRVLLSKAGALFVLMVVLSAALWGVTYLIANVLDVNVTGVRVESVILHTLMVTLFHGYLAMMISAWTGNRGSAAGITTGVMIVSIFATGILPMIKGWEEVARIFPWYYLNSSEPLMNGVDWGHIGILAGCIALFLVVSVVTVNRRDLKSKNVGVTLLDRLRDYPMTQKVVSKLAGSTRVSRIWIKTFSEHQTLIVITGYAMFLTCILIGAIYQFMPVDTMARLVDSYPEIEVIFAAFGGGNFTTPEGFFNLEVFSMVAPAGLIVVGIVVATGAVTGEESRRTMGLLLANPVKRSTIVLEKTVSMVVCAVVTGIATFLGTAAGSLIGGLDMDMGNIAATCLMVTLLGLVFGSLALALGALTGRSKVAAFGSTGVAFVSYIIASFLPLNENLAGYAKLSPYYYFQANEPLVNGLDWWHAVLYLIITVVLVMLSVWFFQRRDLRYTG